METMIIGTKKVKYFVHGIRKGERLKMNKKVLKNWGCPLSFEAAPNSGKNS
jgi:hypothetical protein